MWARCDKLISKHTVMHNTAVHPATLGDPRLAKVFFTHLPDDTQSHRNNEQVCFEGKIMHIKMKHYELL